MADRSAFDPFGLMDQALKTFRSMAPKPKDDLIIDMTDDELRAYATDLQNLHDPANQEDNGYARCAFCHYTRHPCEIHDLATAVLALLDR